MRLLVVEDNQALREQLVSRFKELGYVVDYAENGQDGFFYGTEYPIDLAIVDVGLPVLSGVEMIKKLRYEQRSFPILILTARSRWQEKVEGLEAGADDYLTKPFHFKELEARVAALIRRSSGHASAVIKNGPIELDTITQKVSVDGVTLEFTAFEYRLLHYLMMNIGKVLSKMELTDHLYHENDDRDSNVIEVFIGRLRRKIDPHNTDSHRNTKRAGVSPDLVFLISSVIYGAIYRTTSLG
ncbi:MAG: response regulator [Gammaproteobacteria bacterium]|nr:response regulator [Gammaproteobacteria bacterium]